MIGSTIAFAKAATSARNPFSSLRKPDTEGAGDAGEWRPRAGDRVSNEFLVLEVQEVDVSQESATANDKYLVSKTRLRMMKDCVNDEVLRDELQQFDEWSCGRKLAHARHLQLVERGLAARRRIQDGVQVPCQDLHQDPWHGQPQTPRTDVGKEEKKPEEYVMSTPPPKNMGPGTPSPGLERLR